MSAHPDAEFWQQAIRARERELAGQIGIGEHTWATREELVHMLAVGPTGQGKSRWAQSFCQSVMADPNTTLILIDPSGDLFRALRDWSALTQQGRRVIPFDPTADRLLGYNATGQTQLAPSYRAARKVAAVLKVFGEGEQTQTPRARRWLYNTFVSLIEAGLTLKEALHLVDILDNEYRGPITARTQNPTVKREWQILSKMKLADRQVQLESTANRLRTFLDTPAASILAQQHRAIALEDVVDRHRVLLCNLEPYKGLTPADARVLGLLLLDDIIAAAFSRPEGQRSPVVLVIDEAADYLVPDIGYILRAGRKYNLTCVLCVQELAQLRQDEQVYGDIIANTPTKIVFGDLPEDDLQLLAPLLFRQDWDVHERKLELEHIRLKPVETTRTIEAQTWSESEGEGESNSAGTSYTPRPGLFDGVTTTHEQSSSNHSSGSQQGGSRTKVPWYDYEEVPELSSVTFYTLEELQHRAMVRLKSLKRREIAIKLRGKPVRFDRTPERPNLTVSPELVERFMQDVFTHHPYYATLEEIQAEERERLRQLLSEADEEPQTFGG